MLFYQKSCFFLRENKTPAGLHHTEVRIGDAATNCFYHNPNIQISNLEVPVGMLDGILTKLRNPVNQDSWLTDRFRTSVNHPLFRRRNSDG